MQNAETNVVVRLYLHMSLLDGTTKGLEVHAHLGDFDLNRRDNEREITSASLLGVEDTFKDLAFVLQLILCLDLVRDMLEEVEDRESQGEFFLFLVCFLNNTLLVLDHDGDSHTDGSETELCLEECGRFDRLLLCVTD